MKLNHRKWSLLSSMALSLALMTATAQAEEKLGSTPYGELTVNENLELLFKGRPVSVRVGDSKGYITGNSSLTFQQQFTMGDKRVVLVQDNGGTACPAQFYLVTIGPKGVLTSPGFGSCSDLIKVSQKGDVVTIAMSDYMGPGSSIAQQKKAAKSMMKFVFNVNRPEAIE
jgi:hypothetical protein